ncbi:MAG: iron ABC transporter permease [Prevotellaceae bacterium]|jgi:iron complex transport system permease protein|nr:iron ABC transporter permease [Prevotellaceae bacterium]
MNNRYLFILLFLLLIGFFLLDILFGSVMISLRDFVVAFGEESIYREIIFNFRLPKALTAILTGAALSVAGLLMQTLFRNPLAGPDVLGVTAGASLGVSLMVMSAGVLPAFFAASGWGQILGAVVGSTFILLIVLAVSLRVKSAVSLLIIGIMFGSIVGSVVNILQSVSNPDALKIYIVWTFGSLGAVTWTFMKVMFPIVAVGLLLAFFLQKRLNAILLGEHYAQNLGVSIPQTRFLVILATSLLAGATTAFTGPIAFIGVAVPHLARGFFRTSDHRTLLPACMLCGGLLMLVCDLVSQLPGGGYTLPINSISALFGAPLIIWVIFRNKQL